MHTLENSDNLKNRSLKKISNIYRKMSVLESYFNSFIKKRLQHSCFPVNFVKFLKKKFFYRFYSFIDCFIYIFYTIAILNVNRTLDKDLCTMDNFNFTNFISDMLGYSTECCFHKDVLNNFFQNVLLITFISAYANLLQHFIFPAICS